MIIVLIRTVAAVLLLLSATSVHAQTRVGVGLGALYNGLGLNFSKITTHGLTFGSIGCMSLSRSSGSSASDDGLVETATTTETNCGVGFGFVSSSVFSSSKHTLGASVGLNYNTGTNEYAGIEWSLTPNYVYFLNGLENRGVNVGIGSVLTYRDSGFDTPGVLINVGYHF